jgi:feruloyl esterase
MAGDVHEHLPCISTDRSGDKVPPNKSEKPSSSAHNQETWMHNARTYVASPRGNRTPRLALLLKAGLGASAYLLMSLQVGAAPGAAACNALTTQASPLGLRNTTITGAQYITSATGAYCEVSATVAPSHDMRVRLPDNWQHRYLQLGGGGFDGNIANLSGPFASNGRDPVANGYVVAGDNGGHRSAEFPGPTFAADRGLSLSYATAKILDTHTVAKALVQSYYGQQPKYRYFTGCSNGGKNASVAAANFADYFDGIIGGDGVWGHAKDDVGGSDMAGLTSKWSQSVQTGALPAAKGLALYKKTVEVCDALDGISDGVVSNVRACPLSKIAESLRCKAGDDGSCLTDADLAKVEIHTSPLMLDDRVIGAPWAGTANLANVAGAGLPSGFLALAFRSPAPIDPMGYDIPRQFVDVAAALDGVYSMTGNLDGIVRYLRNDKKLILYHGWEDTTVPSYVSVNFFSALQDADRDASRNARLYMAPGVGHCAGGSGADSIDLLGVMTRWVENNAAPGTPANPAIAWKRAVNAPADVSGAQFTRPLCSYPQFAFYHGHGDPNLAASYVCRPGLPWATHHFKRRPR